MAARSGDGCTGSETYTLSIEGHMIGTTENSSMPGITISGSTAPVEISIQITDISLYASTSLFATLTSDTESVTFDIYLCLVEIPSDLFGADPSPLKL